MAEKKTKVKTKTEAEKQQEAIVKDREACLKEMEK